MSWLTNCNHGRNCLNFTGAIFGYRSQRSHFNVRPTTSNNSTSTSGEIQNSFDNDNAPRESSEESSLLETSTTATEEDHVPLESPEEPTTCCMSGCANCVWLDYTEKLTEYYKDGGEKSIKEINEKITDPNIKAYLLYEIRMRNK